MNSYKYSLIVFNILGQTNIPTLFAMKYLFAKAPLTKVRCLL